MTYIEGCRNGERSIARIVYNGRGTRRLRKDDTCWRARRLLANQLKVPLTVTREPGGSEIAENS